MKTDVTVSVILPTYNRDRLLKRSIKSVLRQTRPDFELIVIDDASTDDTEKVVRSFEDSRIVYLKRTVNHLEHYRRTGEPDNPRNDGLRAAGGRYIAYLDSDDFWRSNLLEVMVDYLDRHPEVGLAYCDAVWHRNLDGREELANCNMSVDFGPKVMRLRNIIRTLTVIHRRECSEKAGFFGPIWVRVPRPDSTYVGIEDWDYWLRIAEHFTVKHHAEVLAHKINKTSLHYHDPEFDPEFNPPGAGPVPDQNPGRIINQIKYIKEFSALQEKVKGAKGWLRDTEGYVLWFLAAHGRGRGEIVEIGSYMGLSTSWLALGSKATGREKVTAVDHFLGSVEHQPGAKHECRIIAKEGTTYRKFIKNITEVGVADLVDPIRASSREAAANWRKPIRLLFIDGEHSYEESKKDFETWSPFLVDEGYVVFHDVDQWPGVTEFYYELLAAGRHHQVLAVDTLRVLSRTP